MVSPVDRTVSRQRGTYRSRPSHAAVPSHRFLDTRRSCAERWRSRSSSVLPEQFEAAHSLHPATPALSRHPPFLSFCATCSFRRQSCNVGLSIASSKLTICGSSPPDLRPYEYPSTGLRSSEGEREGRTHLARRSDTSRAARTRAERSFCPCMLRPALPRKLRGCSR